jgi:hypothetical protein
LYAAQLGPGRGGADPSIRQVPLGRMTASPDFSPKRQDGSKR